MTEIQLIWAWFMTRVEQVRRDPDRGEVMGWAVVVGGVVLIAVTILAILMIKAKDKANSIDLQ